LIKVCDHAFKGVKTKRLSAMMIKDVHDMIANAKVCWENKVEVLRRLLCSEEKIFCCKRLKTHNIYTKSRKNINITKSI
jgi:hypothetical protein